MFELIGTIIFIGFALGFAFVIGRTLVYFWDKSDEELVKPITRDKQSAEIVICPPQADGRVRIKSIRAKDDIRIRVTKGGSELFVNGQKILIDEESLSLGKDKAGKNDTIL
jgi:hypothetical protein